MLGKVVRLQRASSKALNVLAKDLRSPGLNRVNPKQAELFADWHGWGGGGGGRFCPSL